MWCPKVGTYVYVGCESQRACRLSTCGNILMPTYMYVVNFHVRGDSQHACCSNYQHLLIWSCWMFYIKQCAHFPLTLSMFLFTFLYSYSYSYLYICFQYHVHDSLTLSVNLPIQQITFGRTISRSLFQVLFSRLRL